MVAAASAPDPVILEGIAPGLAIPLDIVVQKTAILARSGAGKTNSSVVLVEYVLDHGQQVVILDPAGAWWGLRAPKIEGGEGGYSILILGGDHGDLPLPPDVGVATADFIVDHTVSTILDLSDMSGKQMKAFVADFCTRLYERKSRKRTPLLLVLEEADEMAPQRAMPDATRMLGAVERIAKRGRMRGIGLLSITQRSASFHKDVLSQTELMIAMQTTDPRDIKALDDWIAYHGDPERRAQLLAEIATLKPGEAFVWSPSWLGIFQKVRFNLRRTYDSSATPRPGAVVAEPRRIDSYDLEALSASFQSTVEAAAGENPRILKRKIAELQREIELLKAEKVQRAPVIHIDSVQAVADVVTRLERLTSDLSGALNRAAVGALEPAPPPPAKPPIAQPQTRRVTISSGRFKGTQIDPTDLALSRAERALLVVFAQWSLQGRDEAQLSILSGYSKRSSSFKNALSGLRTKGLIERTDPGVHRITDEGLTRLEALSIDVPPVPHGQEIVRWWVEKLGRAEATIFTAILATYKMTSAPIDTDIVAIQSGYSATSSSFKNAISKLRVLDLIVGSKSLGPSPTLRAFLKQS